MRRIASIACVLSAWGCGEGKKAAPQTQTQTQPQPQAQAQPPAQLPPQPQKKPVVLTDLPAWEGHADGGTVVVHAADVDIDSLRSALAPATARWIVAPSHERVSGRITARSREAAWRGASGSVPALVPGPVTLRGGGVNVDLDFTRAPVVDLARLLGDVTRTNVVMRAPSTEVNLRLRRAGALAVLAEVARVSGLTIERPAKNVIVVSRPGQAPIRRLPTGGPKIRFAARGARAGDVLAFVHELAPSPAPTPAGIAALVCTQGPTVDLRLVDVPRDTVRALVGVIGGVDEHQVGCVLKAAEPADVQTLELVATASAGRRRLALGRVGDRAVLVDDADPQWEVGESYVVYQPATGDTPTQMPLYPDPFAPPPPPAPTTPGTLDRARLALTVVDGDRSMAVIEVDDMRYYVHPATGAAWAIARIADVQVEARIAAGVVELIDPETRLPMKTLRLQAR